MREETSFKLQGLLILITIIGVPIGGCIFTGYKQVGYDEYAVKKNMWTGEIDYDTVYSAGRHNIGVLNTFIKVPAVVQTISFNPGNDSTDMVISSRTKNGLSITFDISYQYKLIKDELPTLIETYGITYEDVFIKTSRDVLREVAGGWTALEFYTNLTDVGNNMLIEMENAFTGLHATIEGLQLTNIDLPDSFEVAREEAEVAKMQEEIAKYIQSAAEIEIQTAILQAQATADIAMIEATMAAQITELNAMAEANATEIETQVIAQRAAIMANATFFNETSGMTENVFTSDQITEFMIVALITDAENATIYMGIDPSFWTSVP